MVPYVMPPDASPAERQARQQDGDLWVFAYGSLMWDPGFTPLEAVPGLVRGFHRDLCVASHLYRGTEDRPGVVLGLRSGGACRGMALRVAAAQRLSVVQALDARELVSRLYLPRFLRCRLRDGRVVEAYTYTVDVRHEQYLGRVPLEEKIRLLLQGVGSRGRSLDYVLNTVQCLEAKGIYDHHLADVLHRAVRVEQGG